MSQGRAAGVDPGVDSGGGSELAAARLKIKAQRDEIDMLVDKLAVARSRSDELEFELKSTQKALARGEQLLDGWRAAVQERERELMAGEVRLVEAELEAERLDQALRSIRAGRSYRLMRIIWRLRRPFNRRGSR
jgi:chromosome segregation ATPase